MQNIREIVIECLKDIAPEEPTIEIQDDTDLENELGITSNMGIELAPDFAARLGISIDFSVNPLISNDAGHGTRRMRNVGEIVQYLTSLLPNQ